MKRAISIIFLLSMVSMITACAFTQKTATKPQIVEGSLIAQVQWPADTSPDLMTIRMTVFSTDMEPKVKYFQNTGLPQTLLGIHGVLAGGNREVSIEGLNANSDRLYTGYAKGITVVPNEIANSGVIVMASVGRKTDGLSSPDNVTVITGNGQITLKWNHVSGAENYNIYMNKKPGVSKKNFDARKVTDRNRYTWDEMSKDKSYYFVVTAESGSGESKESIEVSAKPVSASVVDTPTSKSDRPVLPLPTDSQVAVSKSIGTGSAPKIVSVPPVPPKKTPMKSKKPKGPTDQALKQPGAAEAPEIESRAHINLDQMTPQEILEAIDLIKAPNQNFAVDMTLTFQSGSKKSVNEVSLRVRDFSKSLVIYRYPATQKGRVLLMVDSNMWIYFPGTKRAIRISPQQQLLGQVSNADVARAVFNLDYQAEKIEEDIVDNERLLKMTLKAKTEGAAYGNIQIWIQPEGFLPIKAEFYTLAWRLLKTIYYKNYQNILGKRRPTLYEVHDAIKTSDISTMAYTNWRLEDTPDSYFQKTFLQRVGRSNL